MYPSDWFTHIYAPCYSLSKRDSVFPPRLYVTLLHLVSDTLTSIVTLVSKVIPVHVFIMFILSHINTCVYMDVCKGRWQATPPGLRHCGVVVPRTTQSLWPKIYSRKWFSLILKYLFPAWVLFCPVRRPFLLPSRGFSYLLSLFPVRDRTSLWVTGWSTLI